MSFMKIKAILLHSWYHATHSMETQIDLIWFTCINFIIFGFISKVLAVNQPLFAQNLLMGFLLWEVVRIGQYTITVSMLWEIWSRSFSTFFISSVTLTEWVVAQMISGFVKTTIIVGLLAVVGNLTFGYSLVSLGLMAPVYILILISFAYAAGFFVTGLIFRFGLNIQALSWGLIYLFQPISAVFYPLEALPPQIRWLSYFSPLTYVMQTARQQQSLGTINWFNLCVASVMCVIYCGLSWLFMDRMYLRARKTGEFARLGG